MREPRTGLVLKYVNGKGGRSRALRAAIGMLMAGSVGWAQGTIQPQDRVKGAIAETERVTLAGSVHPGSRPVLAVSNLQVSRNECYPVLG